VQGLVAQAFVFRLAERLPGCSEAALCRRRRSADNLRLFPLYLITLVPSVFSDCARLFVEGGLLTCSISHNLLDK